MNHYTQKALEALSEAYHIVDYFFWLYSLEKISEAEYNDWVNYADQLITINQYYQLLANPQKDFKPEKENFI